MFTIIGGNPFTGYTGTTSFTGLRVVATVETYDEMKKIVDESYDECGGLFLVLENGKEIEYNEDGTYKKSAHESQADKDKEPTIVSVIKDLQYILQIKPTERTEDEIEEFRTRNNFVDGSFRGYTAIGPE